MSDSQTQWWAPTGAGEPSPPPAPQQPPRRSRERGREARQRQAQRRRTTWVVIVVLALLVAAGYVVWSSIDDVFGGSGKPAATTGADFPGPGHGSAQVVVSPGDSGQAIGQTLEDAGVVASASAFVAAYGANPAATGIQPGTYQLLLEMPAADAVDALLNPASKLQTKVTIPEGLTVKQIVTRISEKTSIPLKDLQAAVKDPDSFGLPEQAGGEVEGWLFPATYEVQPDDGATDLLRQMTSATVDALEGAGAPKDQWEDVLIKASLVEREAKHDEDRPKMARAIENRLDVGELLRIDASVAYGAGVSGTELTQAMLDDASNPYNLYQHAGLPPTPIAAPGKKSIEAVMDPADGDWIFWCTVNLETGETEFGVTIDDHNACVAKLNAWIEEHGDE
ncbi:endolytic transglycosylase MltG [Cellulomonas sp. DKR-3]|uniref:Endolytic murein transglycosylase n=1 Tax=Cellulomonas fulva TaxID=2835530 RepID=A0ABS5U0U9_9CELL|nr:endolytic transglycosylase MltG [Cellulomonas fulva]MBT0995029.1 endolytic transglycosylase MltG [Cellulomonas fulva]